jgi:formylglycine-generating enzyme required for sulfatase activity
MMWIPAGRFRLGDIQGNGLSNEQPVHEVSVVRFAMELYEVTMGEFRRFVKATGYKFRRKDVMNAVQFKTVARDGLIKIPTEYKDFLDKELSVILKRPEEAAKRKEHLFESVKKHAFKLPADYKFNRDEMNER